MDICPKRFLCWLLGRSWDCSFNCGHNVIHGYLVGAYWGKQAFSIHQPFKAIGYLGFLSWAFFTGVINLVVGHVRSLYEQGFKKMLTLGYQVFEQSYFD